VTTASVPELHESPPEHPLEKRVGETLMSLGAFALPFVMRVVGEKTRAKFLRMREMAVLVKQDRLDVGEAVYDFYRCVACKKLITRPQELEFIDPTSPRGGVVCSCGYRRYSPTNPRWYEYAYPRVVKFAFLRILGLA